MDDPADRTAQEDEVALQSIAEALRGLRFGSVTVIVQDSVIVQVERLEKKRLVRRSPTGDDSSNR